MSEQEHQRPGYDSWKLASPDEDYEADYEEARCPDCGLVRCQCDELYERAKDKELFDD